MKESFTFVSRAVGSKEPTQRQKKEIHPENSGTPSQQSKERQNLQLTHTDYHCFQSSQSSRTGGGLSCNLVVC